MGAARKFYKKHPVWSWVIAGLLVFMVIGILSPAEDQTESEPEPATETHEEPANEPAERAAPVSPAKPSSPEQRVRDALADVDGPVEDPEISSVRFGRRQLTVLTKTPEGGFEGSSCDDLNRQASAIYRDIYGEGEWTKTGTVISFRGGLVSTDTGQDLPNANTGTFMLPLGKAREIDWENEDAVLYNIDWSLYRAFCHPALKQD